MRSSHGCRIVACAAAVVAALGCSISASADPIPQGWQASNMEPVGYTDLENWGIWVLRYTGPDQPAPTDR